MSKRKVYLGATAIELTPSMVLGTGGEADVYDLGNGAALKLFKPSDHPDYAGSPVEQAAATARLAEHQAKLPAFPARLPDRVVVPQQLATRRRGGGEIVGYAMPLVAGAEPLYAWSEPARRAAGVTGDDAVAALVDLHATVAGLHRAGVVIGDFNDLNVLVVKDATAVTAGRPAVRAHVIDADSFQFDRWACGVFSERFVDPRLCDPAATAPVLVAPHDAASDWFAFAVMTMRSLLFVGPWGGVHKPASASKRVGPGARALRRISVFDAEVVYPRPALHWRLLPDELLAHLHQVFIHDLRAPLPLELLRDLRWTRCSGCGGEHARPVCPTCHAGVRRVAVRVRGAVRAVEIARADVRPACVEVPRRGVVGAAAKTWIDGGALWRNGMWGPERIGDVLAGQTRAWVGERLGFGFYRAGGLTVGFVFAPDRRGIRDDVKLPPIRGAVVDAWCTVGRERAWFFWREVHGGRERSNCAVISAQGQLLGLLSAASDSDDAVWLRAGRGSCAVGDFLFVPTDGGIVRVEVDAGAPRVTRAFPDTEPFVDAAVALHVAPGGLDVVATDICLRLTMG